MNKFLCGFLAFLMVITIPGVHAWAGEPLKVHEELAREADSLVASGKVKGAVLSVVQDGRIELCRGFGYADEYNNISADGEKTAFRIGSVSKTFVAVAALILQQEGLLDMEEDIAAYLEPDFPLLAYPVTMHHLLTHTAGFEDRVTGMAVMNVSDTEPLAASVRKHMPAQVFRPGETASYSNYGIALAAYVIERIAGKDFSQFCSERIFLPLGMTRTTFEHMHDIAYVSKPYLPDGRETLEPYMNLYPEGSAVSTADDMAKYMQWLLDEQDARVLNAQAKQQLFARQFSMAEDLEGVGYVWNRETAGNHVYYDKKGETLHFYTRIALYPEAKSGVFLSFNTYLPEHEINQLMGKATDLIYGKPAQPDKDDGRTTLDIAGLYANNWSSFRTPEKILRILVPGKMLEIKGSRDNGYYLNGERMILTGEDLYHSSIGKLKFISRNGKVAIATEGAISYSKVPVWQNGILPAISAVLFFLLSLACFLRELALRLRKKRKEARGVLLACSLLQILAFCALCLVMVHGIRSFSLLSYTLPIKLCGWIIVAAWATGIGYVIGIRRKHQAVKPIPVVWSLAGLVFCVSLAWLNIL